MEVREALKVELWLQRIDVVELGLRGSCIKHLARTHDETMILLQVCLLCQLNADKVILFRSMASDIS